MLLSPDKARLAVNITNKNDGIITDLFVLICMKNSIMDIVSIVQYVPINCLAA